MKENIDHFFAFLKVGVGNIVYHGEVAEDNEFCKNFTSHIIEYFLFAVFYLLYVKRPR